jgi:hypothetical protein
MIFANFIENKLLLLYPEQMIKLEEIIKKK